MTFRSNCCSGPEIQTAHRDTEAPLRCYASLMTRTVATHLPLNRGLI